MNDLLRKDISIKIVSVFLAVLLWLYVLNLENPYRNRTLTVSLNIENREVLEEKGLVLKNDNLKNTIDITIRGRQEIIEKVRPSDFIATLDFSKVKSANDKFIRIDGPYHNLKDITIVSINPRVIDIQLERIMEKAFPVELVVSNKLMQNYKVLGVTYSPETVKLRNLESLLNSVNSVKAFISISNSQDKLNVKKECRVYNKKGEEIKSLSRNIAVDVNVEIAKEVPIELVLKGSPANDHIEIAREITPKRITISGPYKVLKDIDRVKTEPVDIGNISESIEVNAPVVIPEGVRLVGGSEEVKVMVGIERLVRKEFTVQKEDISLKSSNANNIYRYEILDSPVTFEVKGRWTELQGVDIEDFNPYLVVDRLDEGTHSLTLRVRLPYGMELIRSPQVRVKIEKAEDEQADIE